MTLKDFIPSQSLTKKEKEIIIFKFSSEQQLKMSCTSPLQSPENYCQQFDGNSCKIFICIF